MKFISILFLILYFQFKCSQQSQNTIKLFASPVILTEKTNLETQITKDPILRLQLYEDNMKYQKMMKFLAKLQIQGIPNFTKKEEEVYEQIKQYLEFMKTSEQQMRNDNILAAEMGKEAPHYLYDMNELKSKVQDMSLVINNIGKAVDKYKESQKLVKFIPDPRKEPPKDSQLLLDKTKNAKNMSAEEIQIQLERKELSHKLDQKNLKALNIRNLEQYQLENNIKDQDQEVMKDKKIQKLYNIILNPVTMEDENLSSQQTKQKLGDLDVDTNQIAKDRNIEEILLRDLDQISELQSKFKKINKNIDYNHDYQKNPKKHKDKNDQRFQKVDDETIQELIEYLIKKLKKYASSDQDLQDSLEFSKKFIKKQDFQTALKLISAVQ